MNVTKSDTYMMKQIQKKNSISSNNGYNSQNIEYDVASIYHKKIDSNRTSQKPCINDRVKLVYIDDEYAGLTQDICGTITGISSIKELFRRDNRPESIIWVDWDNGIKLGLIEGVDKYEIISDTKAEKTVILQDSKDQGSNQIKNK